MRAWCYGRLRRGQSEVVGAAIALSLLILTGSVLFSILSRSSRQTSLDLSVRYGFESERALEARSLEVRYGNGVCELVNAGSLRVVIVRLWFKNGTYEEGPVELNPGESDGGVLHKRGVTYAVTSRGNIVPIGATCEVRRSAEAGPGTTLGQLTSESYLNPQRLVGNDFTKRIAARVWISDKGSQPVFVLYNYNNNYNNLWYYNDGVSGWMQATPENVDPDLDDNGINELIVASGTPPSLKVFEIQERGGVNSLELNVTFVRLLKIPENPDVVVVYFKFLAEVSGPPAHSIAVSSRVIISSGSRSVSSPASTSSASFSRAKGGVLVIVGSVTFPIRAYEVLREILAPGAYNLTISIKLDAPSQGNTIKEANNLRLEYVAVTGSVEFNWLP